MDRISKKYIEQAFVELNIEGKKASEDEMSVLEKLIKRCGPRSQIPLGRVKNLKNPVCLE